MIDERSEPTAVDAALASELASDKTEVAASAADESTEERSSVAVEIIDSNPVPTPERPELTSVRTEATPDPRESTAEVIGPVSPTMMFDVPVEVGVIVDVSGEVLVPVVVESVAVGCANATDSAEVAPDNTPETPETAPDKTVFRSPARLPTMLPSSSVEEEDALDVLLEGSFVVELPDESVDDVDELPVNSGTAAAREEKMSVPLSCLLTKS